jgi:hypothetical protein
MAPAAAAPQPVKGRTGGPVWIVVGVLAGLAVVAGGALWLMNRGGEHQAAPVSVNSGSGGSGGSPSTTPPAANPSANPAPAKSQAAPKLPSDPNNPFVGGYIHMRIPGTTYTQSDGNTTTLYISGGAMTASSLLINPDGTYAWNSQWDGKLIRGNWVKDGSDLVLKNGQEGKDWRVMKSKPENGGDILVWDGSIWYVADRAKD